MPAQILDGKALAKQITEGLKQKVIDLKQKIGRAPGITVILVGNNPASQIYVKNKLKSAEEIGVNSSSIQLEETITEAALIQQIENLNQDPNIDGILLQLPIPRHLNAENVLSKITAYKDIDGFDAENMGKLILKRKGLHPCTPKGIMTLLHHYIGDITGKHAVIIGASNIVGRPMAIELLNERCTITVCHRATKSLKAETLRADILVVAAGAPNLIDDTMVKPGAIVVDVGSPVGDVDFDKVAPIASWISPVPGGVGPMTIATLMQNLVLATEMNALK